MSRGLRGFSEENVREPDELEQEQGDVEFGRGKTHENRNEVKWSATEADGADIEKTEIGL